jgi:hypothetical protein
MAMEVPSFAYWPLAALLLAFDPHGLIVSIPVESSAAPCQQPICSLEGASNQ